MQLLFANGNISIIKDGFITSTNNKGMRRKKNIKENTIK